MSRLQGVEELLDITLVIQSKFLSLCPSSEIVYLPALTSHRMMTVSSGQWNHRRLASVTELEIGGSGSEGGGSTPTGGSSPEGAASIPGNGGGGGEEARYGACSTADAASIPGNGGGNQPGIEYAGGGSAAALVPDRDAGLALRSLPSTESHQPGLSQQPAAILRASAADQSGDAFLDVFKPLQLTSKEDGHGKEVVEGRGQALHAAREDEMQPLARPSTTRGAPTPTDTALAEDACLARSVAAYDTVTTWAEAATAASLGFPPFVPVAVEAIPGGRSDDDGDGGDARQMPSLRSVSSWRSATGSLKRWGRVLV